MQVEGAVAAKYLEAKLYHSWYSLCNRHMLIGS